jgi:hypothetical protein
MAFALATFQPPPANVADFLFEWRSNNLMLGIPQLNLNYFPPILSGRIDPLQLKNILAGYNFYLQSVLRSYRRRWVGLLFLLPISIILFAASTQVDSSSVSRSGLIWGGVLVMLAVSAALIGSAIRARRNFGFAVDGLRQKVAIDNNRFLPFGLRWSIAIEERLVIQFNGKVRPLPHIHLFIEALGVVAQPLPQSPAWPAQQYAQPPANVYPTQGFPVSTMPYQTQASAPSALTEDPSAPFMPPNAQVSYNTYSPPQARSPQSAKQQYTQL